MKLRFKGLQTSLSRLSLNKNNAKICEFLINKRKEKLLKEKPLKLDFDT